ncbi:MAG: ABC transporter permease [Candidatus Humimicrobiaceae bacterium]
MKYFKKLLSLLNVAIKKYPIFFAIIFLWIILSFMSKSFLTLGNIKNIFIQSSPVALMAIGMTFVIIVAEIDLSIAGLQTLAACFVAMFMVNLGLNMILAMLITMIILMMLGALSGIFVSVFRFPAFISTLGVNSVAAGLALIITKGYSISGFSEEFNYIGQGNIFGIPVPIIIVIFAFLIAAIVLNLSKFGLSIFAVGGNPEAARLSGIDVGRIKLFALLISAFMASLAGFIIAARMASAQPLVSSSVMLDVIAAVVIGGTSLLGGIGSMAGTAIGVLLLGTIRNGLNLLGVSPNWQLVAIGAVILLAVLVDCLGKRRTL